MVTVAQESLIGLWWTLGRVSRSTGSTAGRRVKEKEKGKMTYVMQYYVA
jgi:hypothetical protein